jgi:molecular chaperone HtpG
MNREDLVENLGTIAHSGAKAFLQQASEGTNLDEIIGQFGVGFYSVFMVANQVTVTSRSHHTDEQAWTWSSEGDSRYTLEPAQKENRGTSIVIHLKDDALEFANAWRLEQIIKKHSDYVSFPIYVTDLGKDETEEEAAETETEEPTPVNRQTAIWRQSASSVEADDYLDFYKQLTFDFNDPMLHLHMVADMPVNLRSILYVPSARERSTINPRVDHGLRLYSRKILIQEQNKDLLPEYLRFIDGVVDSEDLPLNVSRETVQSNPMIRQLRKALTNRVLKEIRTLSEGDVEKYNLFWREFGVFLKEGIAVDPSNKDDLVDMLRFHSSRAADETIWTSLQAYVERMGEDQTEIYYVLGDDMKSVARSPHLDYFQAHDIEVLYLIDPVDGFMMSVLRDYQEKTLRNIDDAGLDLAEGESEADDQAEQAVADDEFAQLLERFKSVLGDQVTDVRESKQLVNSPCRLVSPEDSFDRDLQRVRRLMDEDFETPKKLLELNRRHPMIANLSAIQQSDGDDAVVDAAIAQLFDNALLLEGFHPNPSDMVDRMQQLMEAAVEARAQK